MFQIKPDGADVTGPFGAAECADAEAHLMTPDNTRLDARARGARRFHLSRARNKRRDDGFSLTEVVIAVALLGIIIVPLMSATFTSVSASSTSRQVAEIETVLQNAADRVNRAPVGCDYDLYVKAAAQSKGWDGDLASATYQYYEPGQSARAADAGSWAAGACPMVDGLPVRTAGLVQLVTITITTDTGLVTRTIKVVKSDV